MGQSDKNILDLNNNGPETASDAVLEFEVANEMKSIVELDISELEKCENQIRSLHLEVTLTQNMDQLGELEAKFADLKTKLATVIEDYKKIGVDKIMDKVPAGHVGKTLGSYKEEKEHEFIIAKITHQSFNIPDVIERIINLETVKEKLELKLEEKRMIMANPEKKWEIAEAKAFNINKEVDKIRNILEQQVKYIEVVKDNVLNGEPEKQVKEHLKGIEQFTKKLGVVADAYVNAPINKEAIIGLSVAIGMINELIRGLRQMVMLDKSIVQINPNSFEEEIKSHLNEYILITAVNTDAIEQLELGKKEMNELFDGTEVKYPVVAGVIGEMIRILDILKRKELKINEAKHLAEQ